MSSVISLVPPFTSSANTYFNNELIEFDSGRDPDNC